MDANINCYSLGEELFAQHISDNPEDLKIVSHPYRVLSNHLIESRQDGRKQSMSF